MTDHTTRETSNEVDLAFDRRRPGRREEVSSVLIPLLRGQVEIADLDDAAFGESDQLSAARGIAVSVLLSALGLTFTYAVGVTVLS